MYYNGQTLRLFPDEMIKVFANIFSDSYGNKSFVDKCDGNENVQQLIENISMVLNDKSYDMFRQKYAR